MIKKLKIKVLSTIMFFVTAIIVGFVLVVTVVPSLQTKNEAFRLLGQLAEIHDTRGMQTERLPNGFNGNNMEEPILEKNNMGFGKMDMQGGPLDKNNRFFVSNMVTAEFDTEGNLTDWFSDRADLYEEAYITNVMQTVENVGKELGVFDGQYYLVRQTDEGALLIMIDNAVGIASARQSLIVTSVSGVGVWILLLLLSTFLVNKMTEPVSEAFEKQRQFISDAGHELKTPISVISANANVLQSEIGENKWIDYINMEAKRMELLVRDLMTLAEVDRPSKIVAGEKFDLSKVILSTALPFESLAFEKGIIMHLDIQPDVKMKGSAEQMQQVLSIMLSNAIEYGEEKGEISVTLLQEHKKIFLRVFNTGEGVEEEERAKIFDRFYRVDKARTSKRGNYGLGLAIAKAIVEEHGGEIQVESHYGKWIQFNMIF